MLMPAPAIAAAMAWPNPGLLSPAISRVGMPAGLNPAACAAAAAFLLATGNSSIAALACSPGKR